MPILLYLGWGLVGSGTTIALLKAAMDLGLIGR